MVKKIYTQFFLVTILIFISLFLFFKYFNKTSLEKDSAANSDRSMKTSESVIEDLKYLSTDKEGNEYRIEAQKGNMDKKNPDIIYLENVEAVISLENSDYIYIKSNFAKYNVRNYDTLFNNSVAIDYGEHLLKSEFLNLSFETNLVTIYDNVRYLSGISSLVADKAEIDILNRKTKIFMENPNKKITINSLSKNGNN